MREVGKRRKREKVYFIFFILTPLFDISRARLGELEPRVLEWWCKSKQEERVGKPTPLGPRDGEKDNRRK